MGCKKRILSVEQEEIAWDFDSQAPCDLRQIIQPTIFKTF